MNRCIVILVRLASTALLPVAAMINVAAADDAAWAWRPYRVDLALISAPCPQLPANQVRAIDVELRDRLSEIFVGAWSLNQTDTTPGEADAAVDKRFELSLAYEAGVFVIVATEWDAVAGELGPAIRRTTAQREAVVDCCLTAIREAFRPLARIDEVRGSSARLRFRAAAIEAAPADVRPAKGDVLQPLVRLHDRDGAPAGTEPIDWTLLTVEESGSGEATAVVKSGLAAPFSARRRARSEKFAIAVGKPGGSTTLRITTRDGRPFRGGRVFVDAPDRAVVQIPEADEPGTYVIADDAGRPQTVVVTTQFVPLAKLPLVPGRVAERTVAVNADPTLPAAEERLQTWQNAFFDLYVERRVLCSLAESYVGRSQTAEAKRLLAQLDRLDPLKRRIDDLYVLERRTKAEAGPSQRTLAALYAQAAAAAEALEDDDRERDVRQALQGAAAQ